MRTISWTDTTWNPVTGCTPVSVGCDNCYAARYAKIGTGDFSPRPIPDTYEYGYPREFSEIRLHPDRLELPLRWRKPRRILVCNTGDLFHEVVPFEFIARVFGHMHSARRHVFQVLTKRAKRMFDFVAWYAGFSDAYPREYQHVWLGVTAENQKMADERIPLLLKTPAALRFVSCEPMLGAINIQRFLGAKLINWVICSGETGPGARPMCPDWARSLLHQCGEAQVAFNLKSWGEYCAPSQMPEETFRAWDYHHGTESCWDRDRSDQWRVGKRAAGRMIDGRIYDAFPLTIGQFDGTN